MNKKIIKTVGAVAGVSALAAGVLPLVQSAQQPEAQVPATPVAVESVAPAAAPLEANGIVVAPREEVSYAKIANVQGEFTFDQDVITPADDVFNLFGSVATAMCARPGFAFDQVETEDYFINYSGAIKRTQTVSLKEFKEQGSETRTLKCSCATGSAIANAQVVGVPFKNIVQMAQIDEAVNTVTFKGTDGYGIPMPLSYALENDAILVYQIGQTDIPEGVQVWVPKSVARYFTRSLAEIEFTAEAEVPETLRPQEDQRAKISVLNRFEDVEFAVGDQIVFEGYADDYDVAVDALEFSMDGGETWTACTVENARTDKWVYWYFGYVAEAPGTFKLDVRTRTADGRISPLASSIVFTVK